MKILGIAFFFFCFLKKFKLFDVNLRKFNVPCFESKRSHKKSFLFEKVSGSTVAEKNPVI